MTNPNPTYPPESLEFRILNYLRTSIRSRGGTGRRLSKIADFLNIDESAAGTRSFAAAVRRLETDGAITLEEHEWIGFVYAIPKDV